MDEKSLLTWFEQIDEHITQTINSRTGESDAWPALLTEMQTALESVFPPSHTVLKRWENPRSREKDWIGTFRAAHRLLKDGHARRFVDGIRAETIAQCLDQGETLAQAGYIVAAMILAGGALETHLQNLCGRFSLSWPGDGSINKYKQVLDQARNQGIQDLVTSSDSSMIESWGKDRNTAAHNPIDFAKIKTPPEVRLAIEGIRQFLARTQ